MPNYSIAGLKLNIEFTRELISPEFDAFEVKTTDQFCNTYPSRNLHIAQNGIPIRVLLAVSTPTDSKVASVAATYFEPSVQEDYMQVSATDYGYRFVYSAKSPLEYCDVYTADKKAIIFQRFHDSSISDSFRSATRDQLFFAIRDVFFLFALREGRVPVHSSSIIYNDRAYLFSARSGTGKTTHTNFWVEKYGVEILNGDIAMLALEDGQMYAYGLPWCGTSGRFTNKRVPLGAVIFLYRGEENSIMPLSLSEGITSLLARTLSTSFERKDVEQNLTAITSFAPYTTFLRLVCTNSPDAAETVKQYLDANH